MISRGTPASVLLTGAAGFIGSHLTRLLVKQGHDVTALLRPADDRWRIADVESQICIVDGDLTELPQLAPRLRARRPEVCIHLAWQGWKGTAEDNLASLAVSLDLLRAMPGLGCGRFVSAGTCYEYALSDGCLTETTPLEPREVYGSCKKALFEVGQQFSAATGVSVAAARIFYTYGPYESPNGLVPHIIRALLRGDAAELTPGGQVRDYVHAEDIASAIWAVAQSGVGGAVNIASGEPITVAQIARRLGDLLGKPELVHLGALEYREGEPMRVLGDATRLREDVKWTPRFDIGGGLANSVEWWRDREGVAKHV